MPGQTKAQGKMSHRTDTRAVNTSHLHELTDSPDSFMEKWDSGMPHHLFPATEHIIGSSVWILIR